jgi:hypothetical protein
MRSVADDLREESRAEVRAMTPAERVALALELGERDLELYCQANGLTREEAMRLLDRRRQLGRSTPSRCALDVIGWTSSRQ